MSNTFQLLTQELKDKTFRFARQILQNKEDAQDVVQDLFEKLWRKRSELAAYENVEAFAIQAVKNMCLDKLKHEQRKLKKMQEVELPTSTQDNTYEQQETVETLRKLMGTLPEKQRLVVHLREMEQMEFEEIAQALDMDINAVRMNLSRGRKALRTAWIKTMNYGL